MNELIINDRRVDLSDLTNIGLTFCANNIGELQNRQGNFSNTFKLPITKNNREIFEWSHLQTSASLMAYKKLKATYIQNGVEIVTEGVADISNVDNNYFYINVYSGNVDLTDAIGDITVGELYVNDTPINWNFSNVLNFNILNYYSFPLIDWRKDKFNFFSTDTINVKEMLACLNVKGMFDRMSSKIGYTFNGNYLNSSDHLNMILTPNSFSTPRTDAVKNAEVVKGENTPYTQVPEGGVMTIITSFPTFRNVNNNPDFALGIFKPLVNKIGKLRFTGNYYLYFGHSNTPTWKTLSKKQAYIDVAITDVTGTVNLYGPIMFGPYDYSFKPLTLDIETPEMIFLENTEYKVKIRTYVAQTNKVQQLNLIDYDYPNATATSQISLSRFQEFTPSPKIAYNTAIDFSKIFTMKVKDVLKDILNLRAIIIQTNNYTKTISFNTFEDINLNKSIALDWSKKLQNSKAMGFKFGNYAKKNNFIFKLDTDKAFNADLLNDYYFNLTDEFLDDEKTVVKLNHPTTPLRNRYNGYIVPCINALKDSTNEWLNSDWRILNLKPQSTTFNVNYTDDVTTTAKNQNVPFCNVIGFNELVFSNYKTIQNILSSTKVIKIIAKLDVSDISNLDFSIPIEIQRPDLNISGYFYINKIENYKGGLTSCEIIEI
jgi:hypothetical protein